MSISLALLVCCAALSGDPRGTEWRERLLEQASGLHSIEYRFHVAGGPGLAFLSKNGEFAAQRAPEGTWQEALTVQTSDGQGARRERFTSTAERCTEWLTLVEGEPGQARIQEQPSTALRDIWLPKMFHAGIADQDLATVLGTWRLDELGAAEFDGQACLRVRARPPAAGEREDDEAAAHAYVLWIEAGAEPRIIRIDQVIPWSAVLTQLTRLGQRGREPEKLSIEGRDCAVLVEWRVESFAEPLPGIPVPLRGRVVTTILASGEGFEFEIEPESLRVNEPLAPARFEPAFPDACRVADQLTGRAYLQNRPNQESHTERELLESLRNVPELWAHASGAGVASRGDAGFSSCGANCLFVAALAAGQYVPVETLHAQVYGDHAHPGSLAALSDAAVRLGFDARACKVELGSLSGLSLPAIVQLVDPSSGHEGGHFVMLWKLGEGAVLGSDPPHAPQWIALEKLAPAWTGYALSLGAQQAAGLSSSRHWLFAGAGVLALAAGLALRQRRRTTTMPFVHGTASVLPGTCGTDLTRN